MADSYTEVTHTSLLGNLKNALSGLIVGPLMVLGSIGLLWWNEGRTLETYLMLEEGAGQVIEVGNENIDPNNNKKLIHTTGLANTNESLSDQKFGVSENAIHLRRKVEMYQWKETKKTKKRKKVGGGTRNETTYTYNKTWSEKPISSSNFRKSGYSNPTSVPLPSNKWSANKVNIGRFNLDTYLISTIKQEEVITPTSSQAFPNIAGKEASLNRQFLYYGNQAAPSIGDIRVSFYKVSPMKVSIIAKQNSSNLSRFTTSNGKQLSLTEYGVVDSKSMFKQAQEQNTIIAWGIRAVGFFLIFLGFRMLMMPIVALANIIPIFGSLAQATTGGIAFIVALPLTLTVIGVAWLSHRPIIGGSVIAVSILAAVLYKLKSKSKKAVSHKKDKVESTKAPTKTKKEASPQVSQLHSEAKAAPKFIIYGASKKYGPYTVEKIQDYLDRGKIKLTTKAGVHGSSKIIRVADIIQHYKKAA